MERIIVLAIRRARFAALGGLCMTALGGVAAATPPANAAQVTGGEKAGSSAEPKSPPQPAPGAPTESGSPLASSALPALPAPVHAKDCLTSGDGYFRARLGGAINARIDWPNTGTRCEGETRDDPPGIRLSFQRSSPASPDLLFVFGITGVLAGKPASDTGVNLTVIVQGTNRIYATLGDSRCTVDRLTQRALPAKPSYRVEVRGFCTQPAHSVRGKDALLVSTFEFAGLVTYDAAPSK